MKKFFTIAFCIIVGMLHAQDWQDSFTDAVAKANNENKPIVLVFSGSDWCAPCIQLKRQVLDAAEFRDHANQNYILYNADFPRKKKNQLPEKKSLINKDLAEKYNPKGYFPLVVVLDKNESVLGKTGYRPKTPPKKFIATLNRLVR